MSRDLKDKIAMAALNNMLAGSHFSICTIDTIGEMLGVSVKGEAYAMLRSLHCMDWGKMPAEIKEAVPGLIQECLGVAPVFQFRTMTPVVIEVGAAPKKDGVLKRLGLA